MCLRRVLILSLWRHREPLTDCVLVFTTLQRVFQILVLNMARCVSNGARRGLSPSKRKSLVVDICVFDQPGRRGSFLVSSATTFNTAVDRQISSTFVMSPLNAVL